MVDRIQPRTQPLPKPAPAAPVAPATGRLPAAKAPASAAPTIAKDTMTLAGPQAPVEKPSEPPKDIGGSARKLWRQAIDLAFDPLNAKTQWTPGRPLSEGVNAHSTNTVEDMKHELESDHGYNWLEGDVRFEIDDKNKIEMRHDETHEKGDNLTLREWLEVGKASGRGLKLDFKEGEAIPQALRMIKEIGVPEHRVMINVGDGNAEKYGALIRKELPGAILALNPADAADGKENPDGPYEDWQLDRMIDQAERFGEPVAFVLREDRVTEEIVKKLEEFGPVSIWNSPSKEGVSDPEARREELQEWGVTGVIDLRESMGKLDKLKAGLDWIGSQAEHYEQQVEETIKDVAGDAVDAGKDVAEGGVNLVKKGLDAIF